MNVSSQPGHNDELIQKLTQIVLENLNNEQFGVSKLADRVGINRSHLYRKIKVLTKKSLSQFIREIRLSEAFKLLKEESVTVSEAAYRVGFNNPSYFNKCFHDYYGFPPGEVKKRDPETFEDTEKNQGVRRRRSKYRRTLIIFAAIFTGLVFIWSFTDLFQKNRNKKSIIILPFQNLSLEKETEYFAAGMMEDILNHLSSISDLTVRSRTTSEYIGNNSLSIKEIARQVNARYVMESSVRRYDDRVRITVQLIDARRDRHLWSENFDLEYSNIFGVQSDIALLVAQKLRAELTEDELSQIESIATRNPEAYDNYLRGRFLLNKANSEQRADIEAEGLMGSLKYFEKAIVADTNFAEAYAGMANAYVKLAGYGWLQPQKRGFQKAKELSMKALEIDPNCAEAHSVMGAFHIWAERKFEEGGKELHMALQLNPNFPPAHQWYAQLLMITGPIAEARIHMDHALEIEPYFWILHNLNAWIYYFEEKYDQAVAACFIAQDLKSDFIITNWLLFLNYAKLGEGIKAVEELQTIIRADPKASQYTEEIMDYYNRTGIEGLFTLLIEMNINKSGQGPGINGHPFYIAWWNAILGNKEESIYWLQKNMEVYNRLYVYFNLIALNPDFDILRSDPRFLAIIDKIGLAPYHTRAAK